MRKLYSLKVLHLRSTVLRGPQGKRVIVTGGGSGIGREVSKCFEEEGPDAGRVASACKGGIISFTKTMSRELARKGIQLNAAAPGPTDTPLFAQSAEKDVSHLGVAPTLVRQFMAQDIALLAEYDLSKLRIVTSTDEPWSDDAWLWQIKHICNNRAVPLNIVGGTELLGAILTSTVLHPQKPVGFSGQAPGGGAKTLRAHGSEADICDAAADAGVKHMVMSTGLGASPKARLICGIWHSESQELLKCQRHGLDSNPTDLLHAKPAVAS